MTNILVTGATGFIGGSVLNQLINSQHEASRQSKITAVVRKQDQADRLREHGVSAVLFKGLDDTEHLRKLASEFDLVIHAATGMHTASAEALVQGLGDRIKSTGRQADYVHLTGTSNLAYGDVSHPNAEIHEYSDDKPEEIFPEEERRDAIQLYAQRTTDITVIKTAEANGVRAYMMMPPTVYGRGSGLFNTQSIQLPFTIKHALARGLPEHIGDGLGYVGYVHIRDLASLYEIVVGKILDEVDLPHGRKGFYFSNTGEFTWKALDQRIGEIGFQKGALESTESASIGLDEAFKAWGFEGPRLVLEMNFAAKSKTKAVLAYQLGWKPTGTEKDWDAEIVETFNAVLARRNT